MIAYLAGIQNPLNRILAAMACQIERVQAERAKEGEPGESRGDVTLPRPSDNLSGWG